LLPWHTNVRAHPIALRHNGEYLIKAKCPPNYASMDEAIDEVVQGKFGPTGIYNDRELFARIYEGDYGNQYLDEAKVYNQDVVDCVRDVCNYIYNTHGRFPAHCDAIHVPGVWLQVHHPEIPYYDKFFRNGLTETHRHHDELWH